MNVDQVLDDRRERIGRRRGIRFFAVSCMLHAGLWATVWLSPHLFARQPELPQATPVTLVPPSILGGETPPPPPPPPPTRRPPPPPEQAAPPPPPPPPEPKPKPKPAADVPVLKTEAKKDPPPKPPPPTPRRETPKKPPPPAEASPLAAPPAAVQEPRARRGSRTGNPLGASTTKAAIGVEDPNFTYGYYLNQIVALISERWIRPQVGSEFRQAVLHFRIRRDGSLATVRLVESSGSDVYDRAARRAIETAAPFPPLPRGYKESSLGINARVK